MTCHDSTDFAAKTKEIFSMLDAEELPQVTDYLSRFMLDDDAVPEEPYDMATRIIQCDKFHTFPDFLIEFITELYQTEIEEGNADAMNDLGAIYYTGDHGFAQDFTKAVYYYQMAAEHGSRQAQENLGYCYYYGRDMEKDYEKAFHYYALGAFDGHLISLYKIGDMYLNGYYVQKNEKEAFSYLFSSPE